MDRPRLTIGRLFLGTLIVLGLAFLIVSPQPRIARQGPTVDFVERTVDVTAETAHERLASGLEDELQLHANFGGFGSRVVDPGEHGFPNLRQMRFQMNQNVALSRYAGLGDEAWKQDFSLKTRYKNWFSEYVKNGKPVPFRTDFLIHLEPIEEGKTRIEVIEYEPEVTVGANFHLCERHLVPGVTPGTRPVAPITKDRREMLELVVRVVEREPPPR